MIAKDTGWVTTYKGNCYIAQSREVNFDPSTSKAEIEAFVNEHNSKPARGQVDRLWVKDDGIGLTVLGRFELDSGD